jgi:hypothetical protein
MCKNIETNAGIHPFISSGGILRYLAGKLRNLSRSMHHTDLIGKRELGTLSDFYQPVAKKLAQVTGAEDFNILQNNGRIAHQVVDHVRFASIM